MWMGLCVSVSVCVVFKGIYIVYNHTIYSTCLSSEKL